MAIKYFLAIAILLVVLGLAAWFVYFVDEQTEPPITPAETTDSTG